MNATPIFQSELDCAKWKLRLCLRGRKCHFSGNTIRLEYAYYAKVKSKFVIDTSGKRLITEYWANKGEWMLHQLKKGSQ